MTPKKMPTMKTAAEARLDQLESGMAELKALLRTGFDNMATRMERFSVLEAHTDRLRTDMDRAWEKMRANDGESGAVMQLMAQLQVGLTNTNTGINSLTSAMNGEAGIITKVAVLAARVEALSSWGKSIVLVLGSELIGCIVWAVQHLFVKVFGA